MPHDQITPTDADLCDVCQARPSTRAVGYADICESKMCFKQLFECASGDKCKGDYRYYADSNELRDGLCPSCAELA